MKLKTTKKDVMNQGLKILKVEYCELQTLLSASEPIAYTSGSYGWNCDLYQIDNIIISTGYRPFGEYIDYKLVNEFEKKAEEIKYNPMLTWEEMKKQLKDLLNEFIKVV